MKKTLLPMIAAGLATTLSSQASLILTAVVDGPLGGGTPKLIELYVTADIADLSGYRVELVSNAGSTAGSAETSFSGSATAGDFIYVASEKVK